MNSDDLKERTIDFAVRVLRFTDALPTSASGRAVSNQVARSGCSVAANYRAALRGKSRADFAHKITVVLEEADETELWIEIAKRSRFISAKRVRSLQNGALELVKIFNATRVSARNHKS